MVMDSIRENVSALQIIGQLRNTDNRLSQNISRISSGLRVSRPQDNPADYVIGSRLESEIRGLSRAAINVQSGVGFLNTAIAGIQEIIEKLNDIREDALAASNTLAGDTATRLTLQADIQAALDEIDRIASSTKFNGTSLLNGNYATTAGFRSGTRNFGGTVAFGPESSTLLGTSFLRLSRVSSGSNQVKSGSTSTYNTGITLGTDVAVTTAQFAVGAAAAVSGTSLTTANVAVNRVSLVVGGRILFNGTLANGTTSFSGNLSISNTSTVNDLVTAIRNTINQAETAIGINSGGGTNALETNVTLSTTGRLNFSSGQSGVPSQFNIDFSVLNAASMVQTTFGTTRAASIANEVVATTGTNASIGNSVTAITGSTFSSGTFDIEVLTTTAAQQRNIESQSGFFQNVSLTTAVNSGTAVNASFIGGISLEDGDTIQIAGTDPDGTTFSVTYTVGADTGAGDGLVTTFADLVAELNHRDRSDTGYGFNQAIATLSATGTIQLFDDVSAASSTDLTFTVTDVGNSTSVTVNSNVVAAGASEGASVRIANGNTVNVTAGETVTLVGDSSLATTGDPPQVTLRFGSGFTTGTDQFVTTAAVYQGSLNGGTAVQFSNGSQNVTFLSGSAAVAPAEKNQRLTLNFDSVIDITTSSSTGSETFYISASSRYLNFQIGARSGDDKNIALADLRTRNLGSGASNTLDDVDVTTISGADAAIIIIDNALEQVGLASGRIGGLATTLDERADYLTTASETVLAGQASILGADVAKETTELTLNTVFQQAQTAILAQANASKARAFEILFGLD